MEGKYDAEFVLLCNENYHKIKLYCLAKLDNKSDSEDITQETFKIAYEKIEYLQTHDNVVGFLYQTAKNLIHEKLRDRAAQPIDIEYAHGIPSAPDAFTEIENDLDKRIDELLYLDKTLSVLTEKNRNLYDDYYKNKLTMDEIAQKYKMSPTSVRMRFVRIRRELKDAAKKLFE